MNDFLIPSALGLSAAGLIFWKLKSRVGSQIGAGSIDHPLEPKTANTLVAVPAHPEPPQRIVIGEDPERPVVEIELCTSIEAYENANNVPSLDGPISRLSPLLQVVPEILTSMQMSGKHIMEVTINGSLTRAADGNGYRAFAMGSRGISEHAKLFEVQNLQTIVNAAGLWRIASVVVAQKHLADISRKLDDIRDSVHGVATFLEDQRAARIHATYSYLSQAYTAIKSGELPTSIRAQLETCERDLLEIQDHLGREYKKRAAEEVTNKEFGTKEVTSKLIGKASKLNEIAADISLCLKTRIAAWHVLALFPGEPHLKLARQQAIQAWLDELNNQIPQVRKYLERDLASITSFWNTQETLDLRKAAVTKETDQACKVLNEHVETHRTQLTRTDGLLIEHDRPIKLLVEVQNGQILGAREPVSRSADSLL